MKSLLTCLFWFAICCLAKGEEESLSTPMRKLSEMTKELAESGGFSDDDATVAGIFLIEQLEGPLPKGAKLETAIQDTQKTSVVVFVCYNFGLKYRAYDIEFRRGDIQQGERWGFFRSLKHIPGK